MVEESVRVRREPPAFVPVVVTGTQQLSPRMIRVTFSGHGLAAWAPPLPAASVRLLLPSPGTADLVIPQWQGNEFLLADGSRPLIRTFTPRRLEASQLDLDMVIHAGGLASNWAINASAGSDAAVSGPGRGYTIDASATRYVLAGDETAIPAISQLLEELPPATAVEVQIEVSHDDARLQMPNHPAATVNWSVSSQAVGDELVRAIAAAPIDEGVRFWCAGEAAAMHRIRNHLFKERGLPRSQATVRGYWKARIGHG